MVTRRFIVFEGIDGSGTTTQARRLHERLLREGTPAMLTGEPTDGPIGLIIRQVMTGRLHIAKKRDVVDRHLAYLFAADRYDHLYNDSNGIIRNLKEGWLVISTRYYLSSLAYHVNNAKDHEIVFELNRHFPNAGLTFYLDCPVHEALKRLTETRPKKEKYENRTKLKKVYTNYQKLVAIYDGNIVLVDATQSIERQHEEIYLAALDLIRGKKTL